MTRSFLMRAILVAMVLAWIGPQAVAAAPVRIVLIGGPKSHGPAEHDFPDGIRVLKDILQSSPDIQPLGRVEIVAYPDGWPKDDFVLDGASTIVWYFDGLKAHPLNDAARRARFERLMKRGVGLVALHQAFTVSPDDRSIDLPDWLGGVRYGMVDRTTETVAFEPAKHPVSRGVGPFTYTDEFYPSISFRPKRVKPILVGKLHIQFAGGEPQIMGEATNRTVAWAFDRAGGGRSFGFSGLHYLVGLDDPQVRTLLLDAIFWTAGLEVPDGGVRSVIPRAATELSEALERSSQRTLTADVVRRAADNPVIDYPWGRLTWYASGALKNSDYMTVGEAVIMPGRENASHVHPNCEEILHVVSGHIVNFQGDHQVELRAGDTVSIPAGVAHHTRNIGPTDAVLSLSYASADRQIVAE